MAPAEVGIFRSGIGQEDRKVHRGDAQKFETEEIKADVVCHGLDLTEVNFSGQNIDFMVRTNDFSISTEGTLEKGRVRTLLRKENDSVEITDRQRVRSRMKITHTKHDGSTGEVG